MPQDWIEEVLHFWFVEVRPEQWFERDHELDTRILERFTALHERVTHFRAGELDTPHASLAGVIVLDQFPRNIYRDSPQAFLTDSQAVAHARDAIERKFDRHLTPQQRMFLYLPYQHAEDLELQKQSVELFDQLGLDEPAEYAREHKRVIDRFGRFPHRNAVLGRESTAEEVEFLKSHPGF
ncbi:MAG: DUF924 family protein [Steroidobacteraceae bacterium]